MRTTAYVDGQQTIGELADMAAMSESVLTDVVNQTLDAFHRHVTFIHIHFHSKAATADTLPMTLRLALTFSESIHIGFLVHLLELTLERVPTAVIQEQSQKKQFLGAMELLQILASGAMGLLQILGAMELLQMLSAMDLLQILGAMDLLQILGAMELLQILGAVELLQILGAMELLQILGAVELLQILGAMELLQILGAMELLQILGAVELLQILGAIELIFYSWV
nr:hypothetical protein BaRGS_035326 [Batillaria attramentaria]